MNSRRIKITCAVALAGVAAVGASLVAGALHHESAAEALGSQDPVVEKGSVTYEAALEIARNTITAGKEQGIDLGVAIVDDSGIPLVVLRADDATEQFVTGAERKAWTSVNLRDSTRNLLEDIKKGEQDDSQLPYIRGALFLMGGVPFEDRGTVVGAVGVAGSVNGLDDDAFARRAASEFSALLDES